MNKVKRSKNQATIIMDRIHNLDKWKWICTVCNTEYVMRWEAQQCNHKEFKMVEGLGMRWVSKITGKVDA